MPREAADACAIVVPAHGTPRSGRRAGKALNLMPRSIAVASGKGGVGKTWLTLSLAQALSARKKRTLVLDGDFRLANADIQLGCIRPSDLGDILKTGASLLDSIVRVPEGGFDLIVGETGSDVLTNFNTTAIDRLVAGIRDCGRTYEVVLFDVGTGVEPVARKLVAHAETLVLITTEDPTSLTDAYAVLKLLQHDRAGQDEQVDARIVVNQADTEQSGRRAHSALARAARGFLRLDPPLLGVIRRDSEVPEAIRTQRLFLSAFPASPTTVSIQRIARRLLAK